MSTYDFSKIERHWQGVWREERIYEPDLSDPERPFYNLMMFPYPSAEGLHVGNMYAFTGSDIYGRMKRMQGYDVFEPIGLDGFGIHSENYAIKIGAHPMEQAKVSAENFYRQLHEIGDGFAWDERLETYDPAYYRWTQWLFIQLWKNGLAYRKKQAVNWCPSCKTVLSDEQAEGGRCERCGTAVVKKDLEQWFFRITKYADRLLKNLEKLDWSEKVKIAQKNWIGESEGARIKFKVQSEKRKVPDIEVFTTRPDTLFGATFMVISPELAQSWIEVGWQAGDEVRQYVKTALANRARAAEDDEKDPSTGSGREKTGVFAGISAINPANEEKIPVWVADYVLAGYGTGAIMAVPAHDERDYAFAKQYDLPIREVVIPERIDKRNPPVAGKKKVERRNVHVIVRNPKNGKYLCLRWKKFPWTTFPMGGIEEGENTLDAARREVREETGYVNLKGGVVLGGPVRAEYFAAHKDENRVSITTAVQFDLADEEQEEIAAEEREAHEPFWAAESELTVDIMVHAEMDIWLERMTHPAAVYVGAGVLDNSGRFTGMDSEKAKGEITKFVRGEWKTQYRLRDWLISRQRYWGPPIPMIFCAACAKAERGEQAADMPGWYAAPEKDLPVELPFVKDFRPRGTGESPLATVKEFYETTCPGCGGSARRETDVSDTFLDSAWYYLRYLNPQNEKAALDAERVKSWLPVHMYIGGAEHSVLHLLYVRFIAMALHDMEIIHFEEPMTHFRAHGLLIKEGTKMSKSKGNIVNPDEYIKKFGADVLRTYLMFLAPFEQGGDFRDAGILGVERFLRRVWRMAQEIGSAGHEPRGALHAAVKKVTGDIETLSYNTAISALMICLNEFDKDKPSPEEFGTFAKLLAPFAPHMAEEIWREVLGHETSIHKELWPVADERYLKEDTFTLVIQVNGKLRDSVEAPADLTKDAAQELALGREKVQAHLGGKKPQKVIFVPGRLINFVL